MSDKEDDIDMEAPLEAHFMNAINYLEYLDNLRYLRDIAEQLENISLKLNAIKNILKRDE